MKKVLALILAALTLLPCAVAAAEGTFRVGMECNYAPYNWTQAEPSEYAVPIEGGGGYADGYDVQIAKRIAEGLGKELVIVKTEWDGLPMGVMSGAVDGYVAEEDGAQGDTAANPDLTYIKFDEDAGFEASEGDTSIAVGLAKGSELLAPINEILAGIDDATRDQLMADAKARQPLNQ